MNKSKISLLLIITGSLLVSISLGLIIYNNYVDKLAGQESEKIVKIIEKQLHDNTETKKQIAFNNDYFGIIEIPSLNLKLPIMKEWSYDKLKTSPCIYYGSIKTNNLVICAHSYKSLFRYIKDLIPGDKIIITDIDGNKYLYEVKIIETLSPTSIKEMVESDFALTLYTCTNDNQNRITVRLSRL